MLDQERRTAPLTISEQLRAVSSTKRVIDLAQPWPESPPPQPPDPLAVLKEGGSGWADPEALAEAARYVLRVGNSETAMLRGIGLAVLALRAELRDAGAER